jgi:hypothetical protein
MKTLGEAWKWYTDVKKTLACMARLGEEKFWNAIPWHLPPWLGNRHLVELTSTSVVSAAENAVQHLDDLAVVVLFSVFEANVRDAILEQMSVEEPKYHHRAILDAIMTAKERIREGSFYAVLSSFKGSDNGLIEEVNQVRRYRNWVSHGRRGPQPPLVIPHVAYDRLTRCLALLFPDVPDEWAEVAAYYARESYTKPGAMDVVYWNKGKRYLQELVRTGKLKP